MTYVKIINGWQNPPFLSFNYVPGTVLCVWHAENQNCLPLYQTLRTEATYPLTSTIMWLCYFIFILLFFQTLLQRQMVWLIIIGTFKKTHQLFNRQNQQSAYILRFSEISKFLKFPHCCFWQFQTVISLFLSNSNKVPSLKNPPETKLPSLN